MKGDFPPSSNVTGFRLLVAAACITRRPTSVDPVKLTWTDTEIYFGKDYIVKKIMSHLMNACIDDLVYIHMGGYCSPSRVAIAGHHIEHAVWDASLQNINERDKCVYYINFEVKK